MTPINQFEIREKIERMKRAEDAVAALSSPVPRLFSHQQDDCPMCDPSERIFRIKVLEESTGHITRYCPDCQYSWIAPIR